MLTSYHVHSNFSDGTSTISEIVEAASSQGLDEVGISDHYVLTPDNSQLSWSMDLGSLDSYVSAIDEARSQTKGIVVKTGIEADYFPETVEELKKRLAQYDFDYIIGSVHVINGFPIDEHAKFWKDLSDDEINDIVRKYWIHIREMASSRVFDFAAHLDLYKKFGYRPTGDFSREISEALDALSEANMPVEINTSGWHKEINEAYPSLAILIECKKRDIPVLINADAHDPSHLTRDYTRAYALMHEAGYEKTTVYTRREYALKTPIIGR